MWHYITNHRVNFKFQIFLRDAYTDEDVVPSDQQKKSVVVICENQNQNDKLKVMAALQKFKITLSQNDIDYNQVIKSLVQSLIKISADPEQHLEISALISSYFEMKKSFSAQFKKQQGLGFKH